MRCMRWPSTAHLHPLNSQRIQRSRMFTTQRFAALTAPLILGFAAACGGDGPSEPPPPGGAPADISADITADRTLSVDTTYTLKGFIHVTNGATLTIPAGTTIKGDFGVVGSSLFIMRGAKIIANGTADKPIVFTSSRAAGQRQPGDWGGLIIVGNAIDNRTGSVE